MNIMKSAIKKRTFVIEAINAIDRSAFVIAAEDEKVLGILHLVGEKQTDGFQRLFTSVNVVTMVAKCDDITQFKQTETVHIHTPRTSSWQPGGSLHTQKDEEDHSIDHEYHLAGPNDSVNIEITMSSELSLPQILMGASSSSRTG